MILVTGASGQVGKHLLKALSGKGIPVHQKCMLEILHLTKTQVKQ